MKRQLGFSVLGIVTVLALLFAYIDYQEHKEIGALKENPVPALQDALPEVILGNKEAPFTLVEYSSLTCSHCADFHTQILPLLKKEYIDAGKLKLIFREFPSDAVALRAFVVVWCAGKDHYFEALEHLFKTQQEWISAEDPFKALQKEAYELGISPKELEKCIANDALINAIVARRLEGQQHYAITGTPTFYLNGARHEGVLSLEAFKELLSSQGSHDQKALS